MACALLFLRLIPRLRKYFFFPILYISGFIMPVFFCLNSAAQNTKKENPENNYRAVHWGIDEGLSHGVVYAMIKDLNGFLWFGTEVGLNRFDGSYFKNYFKDKSNRHAINGNEIFGLIEDSLHNIWIGTEMGLSRYDIRADTIKNFLRGQGYASSDAPIVPFWATRDELYCLEMDTLITVYNIHSFAKKKLEKLTPTDSLINGDGFRNLIFDVGSNSVWIQSGELNQPGGALLKISLTNGKREKFSLPCYYKIPNHSHFLEGMRFDWKRNSIWIINLDGLMEFTLNDKQFHHIDELNKWLNQELSQPFAGIEVDLKGRIWAGTYPTGIIIYDPSNHSVSLPFPNDSVLQHNVSAANLHIYCDRDGIVWSSSWLPKGINQLIPISTAVIHYKANIAKPHSLSVNRVGRCIDDGRGRIWLSSADGLNIFDPKTGLFQVLRKEDLPGIKGEDNVFNLIFIDSSAQKAWINADRLYQMDMVTKQCLAVIFKDSANQIIPLRKGGFPTSYKKGCFFSLEYGNRQLIFIGNSDSPIAHQVLAFPAGTIDNFNIATDDDHLLFLRRLDTTVNLTYTLVNGQWIRTPYPLDSIQWEKIIYNNADQSFWVAAEKQLLHYNKKFQLIRNYTREDGLPDFNICAIIPDNRGNIWFNTDRSIHQLNMKTGRISLLSEKDGIPPQTFPFVLGYEKSASGELYLPGGIYGEGFNRFIPDKLRESYPASAVYLQSLLVNQKLFPLPTGINSLLELSLKSFQNKITIQTGILDFYTNGKNHLRYKLGENADWQYPANSANYTIHYEDLAPGNYQLVMQASNASNEFNGPEKILYFHISPPWWQTWWAISLFALGFSALLWTFISYRSRALKEKNIQLEEKIMRRTSELKHSLEELKETQTQLVQREKMASLGELTAGIAHEIQNPLNFVNNFSEVNKELIEELREEQKKQLRDPENEGHLLNDIEKNLEKINQHGKRADAIVKGMLQHSRSSSGIKELVDINALTGEYMRLSYHGQRAKDKFFNASLQSNFDENIGRINVIQQDIGRVLLNLFNNAFYSVSEKKKKLGDSYEPAVSVSTLYQANEIMIRVRDNGMGISQKIAEKIFQPFFTTKPSGEGTGLGLSLSYDIITKMHGGELKVETVEGEGAEFVIVLPA